MNSRTSLHCKHLAQDSHLFEVHMMHLLSIQVKQSEGQIQSLCLLESLLDPYLAVVARESSGGAPKTGCLSESAHYYIQLPFFPRQELSCSM